MVSRRALLIVRVAAAAAMSQASVSAQTPPAPADYRDEAVVIEQVRTLLRFEDDGTGRRETYTRIRTHSEAGVQQYGELVFGYNAANERAEIAFVRVSKQDGTVVATPDTAVQDLSAPVQRIAPVYTDFRQKHVTVQSLRPGDTLEFRVVTVVHTALAPGQFWGEYNFQRDAVVLDEALDVDLPATRTVTIKSRPGFEAIPKDADGRRVYHWSHRQLKDANERKASTASADGASPQRSAEPGISDIRLTTFRDWQEVGAWFAALEAPQRVATADVRKKAAELIAGKTTDREKLEALYTFVASNLRYVSLSLGAGRYQPRRAGAVLQEQYGDCKDKHTLLASLIDAVGLNASAVLISTAGTLDPDFPSPSQFDHVITLAAAGGEAVWLDTTAEVAPFGLLMPGLRNKQALVAAAAGTRLEQTPASPPMKTVIAHEIDATLDSHGKLAGRVRVTLRGDVEVLFRTLFRGAPAAKWKEIVEAFVKTEGTPGEVTNWKISDPASVRDPFSIEFDLSVAQYAEWTSNNASVPLPLPVAIILDARGLNGDDEKPVSVGSAPAEISYKLRLRLPSDVTARPPVAVTVARDYASYRTTYIVDAGTLTAERLMNITLSELPAARRQDYRAFLAVVATDVLQPLAFDSSASRPSTGAAGLTSAELHHSGLEALKSGDYAHAVALLTRAVEADAKNKAAWSLLGRAHMSLHEPDDAIRAFERQIALDAYDTAAYNDLGRAYVAKQEYGKAETAFLHELEVNPLDKAAMSSLGAVYLDRHEYDRAAAQFEKLIALSPNDAWPQFQVGKAYLNLKDVSRATAAFDRAVAAAPTPFTWNNIAYELALAGTQLDRAQQYAESAVSSMAAASRTLDVSRVDVKSLNVMRSLALYWDTLGWVHFVRGDAAPAKLYVEMAWKLSQHAEVGDHLAQIYEKEGRRDDAIRMYAIAMSAPRPSADIRNRLAAAVGDSAKVDAVVDAHRAELTDMVTFRVAAAGRNGTNAEFALLFAPPGAVESVTFIGGDESLRPLAEAIRGIAFGRMFPDDTPAKILRRGVLRCPAGGACSFTLVAADDAKPVK